MKANNPEEAHRWTQAIEKSIEWYKMGEGTDGDALPAMSPSIFTGDNGDLHSWVDELNDYFSRDEDALPHPHPTLDLPNPWNTVQED